MSAKKGRSAKTGKPAKPATKRSLRDLDVRNDKSKNIKGGSAIKFIKFGAP